MPVTFPAHQGFIVGAKLRWPKRVDATALCISAASPDLTYTLTTWLAIQSQRWVGIFVWVLPVTIISCSIVRWRAASGIFAQLPDFGLLRLRSFRVLGHRSPRTIDTIVSAMLGGASHMIADAFTHDFRWGANLLNLNDTFVNLPVVGEFTEARVLQYLGHSLGSIGFVGVLLIIASKGKLAEWYGETAVNKARQVDVSPVSRIVFWSVLVVPIIVAGLVAPQLERSSLFAVVTASFVSILAAGSIVGESGSTDPTN